MKDYNFKIKAADILQDSSLHDSVKFEWKFSTLLPQLTEPWVSASITIQWLDNRTILLTFEDIVAYTTAECDICWEEFIQEHRLERLEAKCFFDDDVMTQEFDDVIQWDTRTKTIDVENFLIESLRLSLPVVNVCTNCQKKTKWDRRRKCWTILNYCMEITKI